MPLLVYRQTESFFLVTKLHQVEATFLSERNTSNAVYKRTLKMEHQGSKEKLVNMEEGHLPVQGKNKYKPKTMECGTSKCISSATKFAFICTLLMSLSLLSYFALRAFDYQEVEEKILEDVLSSNKTMAPQQSEIYILETSNEESVQKVENPEFPEIPGTEVLRVPFKTEPTEQPNVVPIQYLPKPKNKQNCEWLSTSYNDVKNGEGYVDWLCEKKGTEAKVPENQDSWEHEKDRDCLLMLHGWISYGEDDVPLTCDEENDGTTEGITIYDVEGDSQNQKTTPSSQTERITEQDLHESTLLPPKEPGNTENSFISPPQKDSEIEEPGYRNYYQKLEIMCRDFGFTLNDCDLLDELTMRFATTSSPDVHGPDTSNSRAKETVSLVIDLNLFRSRKDIPELQDRKNCIFMKWIHISYYVGKAYYNCDAEDVGVKDPASDNFNVDNPSSSSTTFGWFFHGEDDVHLTSDEENDGTTEGITIYDVEGDSQNQKTTPSSQTERITEQDHYGRTLLPPKEPENSDDSFRSPSQEDSERNGFEYDNYFQELEIMCRYFESILNECDPLYELTMRFATTSSSDVHGPDTSNFRAKEIVSSLIDLELFTVREDIPELRNRKNCIFMEWIPISYYVGKAYYNCDAEDVDVKDPSSDNFNVDNPSLSPTTSDSQNESEDYYDSQEDFDDFWKRFKISSPELSPEEVFTTDSPSTSLKSTDEMDSMEASIFQILNSLQNEKTQLTNIFDDFHEDFHIEKPFDWKWRLSYPTPPMPDSDEYSFKQSTSISTSVQDKEGMISPNDDSPNLKIEPNIELFKQIADENWSEPNDYVIEPWVFRNEQPRSNLTSDLHEEKLAPPEENTSDSNIEFKDDVLSSFSTPSQQFGIVPIQQLPEDMRKEYYKVLAEALQAADDSWSLISQPEFNLEEEERRDVESNRLLIRELLQSISEYENGEGVDEKSVQKTTEVKENDDEDDDDNGNEYDYTDEEMYTDDGLSPDLFEDPMYYDHVIGLQKRSVRSIDANLKGKKQKLTKLAKGKTRLMDKITHDQSTNKLSEELRYKQLLPEMIEEEFNFLEKKKEETSGPLRPVLENSMDNFHDKMAALAAHIDRLEDRYFKLNRLEDDYISREFPDDETNVIS